MRSILPAEVRLQDRSATDCHGLSSARPGGQACSSHGHLDAGGGGGRARGLPRAGRAGRAAPLHEVTCPPEGINLRMMETSGASRGPVGLSDHRWASRCPGRGGPRGLHRGKHYTVDKTRRLPTITFRGPTDLRAMVAASARGEGAGQAGQGMGRSSRRLPLRPPQRNLRRTPPPGTTIGREMLTYKRPARHQPATGLVAPRAEWNPEDTTITWEMVWDGSRGGHRPRRGAATPSPTKHQAPGDKPLLAHTLGQRERAVHRTGWCVHGRRPGGRGGAQERGGVTFLPASWRGIPA